MLVFTCSFQHLRLKQLRCSKILSLQPALPSLATVLILKIKLACMLSYIGHQTSDYLGKSFSASSVENNLKVYYFINV